MPTQSSSSQSQQHYYNLAALVSKATLGKPLRDGVGVHMGIPERLDTNFN